MRITFETDSYRHQQNHHAIDLEEIQTDRILQALQTLATAGASILRGGQGAEGLDLGLNLDPRLFHDTELAELGGHETRVKNFAIGYACAMSRPELAPALAEKLAYTAPEALMEGAAIWWPAVLREAAPKVGEA